MRSYTFEQTDTPTGSYALYAAPVAAQAPEQFVPDAAMNFGCYLIDHCEGETIKEESVQVPAIAGDA